MESFLYKNEDKEQTKDTETQDNKRVVLYTIHCHNCNALEKKLQDKGIPFEINEDIETMKAKGFTSAPMLEVNGTLYNFTKALKWLKDQTC